MTTDNQLSNVFLPSLSLSFLLLLLPLLHHPFLISLPFVRFTPTSSVSLLQHPFASILVTLYSFSVYQFPVLYLSTLIAILFYLLFNYLASLYVTFQQPSAKCLTVGKKKDIKIYKHYRFINLCNFLLFFWGGWDNIDITEV